MRATVVNQPIRIFFITSSLTCSALRESGYENKTIHSWNLQNKKTRFAMSSLRPIRSIQWEKGKLCLCIRYCLQTVDFKLAFLFWASSLTAFYMWYSVIRNNKDNANCHPEFLSSMWLYSLKAVDFSFTYAWFCPSSIHKLCRKQSKR